MILPFYTHITNFVLRFFMVPISTVYTQKNKFSSDTQPKTNPALIHSDIRIYLSFRLFKTAFNKLHAHSHTGNKITYNTFLQCHYLPFLEKWLSIFILDCLECQRNKHFNMKIGTAPDQSFLEHAPSFNYQNDS